MFNPGAHFSNSLCQLAMRERGMTRRTDLTFTGGGGEGRQRGEQGEREEEERKRRIMINDGAAGGANARGALRNPESTLKVYRTVSIKHSSARLPLNTTLSKTSSPATPHQDYAPARLTFSKTWCPATPHLLQDFAHLPSPHLFHVVEAG